MQVSLKASYDPYGDGPMCLLSSNSEGKWNISKEAINTLENILQPLASVAIVGKAYKYMKYMYTKILVTYACVDIIS